MHSAMSSSDSLAGPSSASSAGAGVLASSSSSNGKAPIPQNLRFQRRTSERAFYEGAYREGTPTMEYPSGASPWASSPEASRASFGGDVPREDLPAPAVHVPGSEGGSSSAEHVNGHAAYQQQAEQGGGWTPEQQHQWQHQQQQGDQQQRGPGEENRRPASARYHNVPQQQRQHMPQYKLQAKITGLERTGKKDPILRFDVHVCYIVSAHLMTPGTDHPLDQSAKVQNHSIPGHPPYAFRVRKASIPSSSIKSRSTCACRAPSYDQCRNGNRRR